MDPTFGIDAETGSPVSLEGFDLPLYTPPARGETDGENVGITPFEASRKLSGDKD